MYIAKFTVHNRYVLTTETRWHNVWSMVRITCIYTTQKKLVLKSLDSILPAQSSRWIFELLIREALNNMVLWYFGMPEDIINSGLCLLCCYLHTKSSINIFSSIWTWVCTSRVFLLPWGYKYQTINGSFTVIFEKGNLYFSLHCQAKASSS